MLHRQVHLSPYPGGGGIYYAQGLTRNTAFKAAMIIGEECYRRRLIPCVIAHAELAVNNGNLPAEILFQIPPLPDVNAAHPERMQDFPKEVYYPPRPDHLQHEDLLVGDEQDYLDVLKSQANTLSALLKARPARQRQVE